METTQLVHSTQLNDFVNLFRGRVLRKIFSDFEVRVLMEQ